VYSLIQTAEYYYHEPHEPEFDICGLPEVQLFVLVSVVRG